MANPDFLKFLFETSQEQADAEAILEELQHVEDLKVAAKPLISALKALGVTSEVGLAYSEEGVAVEASAPDEYRSILDKLAGADAMNKLAEMGWVAVPSGEHNGQNGESSLRVYFLQITKPTGDGTENSDDVPDLDALIGKAQELGDEPDKEQAAERKKKEKFESAGDIAKRMLEYEEEDEHHVGDEFDYSTDCPVCGGAGVPLGSLGSVRHFRCRQCGSDFEK